MTDIQIKPRQLKEIKQAFHFVKRYNNEIQPTVTLIS